jgi:hypothetical protein
MQYNSAVAHAYLKMENIYQYKTYLAYLRPQYSIKQLEARKGKVDPTVAKICGVSMSC